MIEGLKVTISGEELHKLCLSRAEYHAKRAKDYEATLATLESLNVPNTSNRPGDDAKNKIEHHKSLAAELEFIGRHIAMEERFLLDASDLHKLGIAYSGYR